MIRVECNLCAWSIEGSDTLDVVLAANKHDAEHPAAPLSAPPVGETP